MASTITDTRRSITITDVRDVVVTEIVAADGEVRRAIRILGEPVVNNVATEILEIIVVSAVRADIELSAPGQEF